MNRSVVGAVSVALLVLGSGEAFAGGFLKGLVGRGTVRGAAAAARATGPSSPSSASPSSPAKTYGPNILTVDQLAACLKTASGLDTSSQSIDTERAALEKRISDVDARRTRLEEAKRKIDRSSKSAIDRHNAAIASYNKLVNEAKAKQTAFNERVRTQNAKVDAYNGECAKQYYAEDLAAARAKANVTF